MKQLHIIHKVEGGKLLKIKLSYDTAIRKIQILGDFFLHPEDGVFAIEEALLGSPLDAEAIKEKVKQTQQQNNIEMIGISAEAIAAAIMGSLQ